MSLTKLLQLGIRFQHKIVLCASILFSVSSFSPVQALSWHDAISEGERRLKLQQLDLAEGCFRQAVRDVKRDRSSKPDDVAYCMARLAAVLQDLDISEEAGPLYKKAIKVLERAHGRQSASLLPDLMALGYIYENDGDFKKAGKLYSRSVEIASIDPGPASLTLADCQHSLGRLNFKEGQFVPAELCYRAALALVLGQKTLPSSQLLEEIISDYTDLLEKSYAPGKNVAGDVRSELLKDRLAELSRKKGVPASSFEKEVSVRLARDAYDKISGDAVSSPAANSPSIASALPVIPPSTATADFVAREPLNQQRIDFYERMIAIDIKSLGPEHPSVARDLSGLAAVYMAGNRYEDAKTLFMRALKIYEKVYGGDALLVKRTRAMLELICENQTAEDSPAAGTNFVAELPALPVAAQKIDIAIRLNYLAALCYSLGKIADAEKIYAWALADTYCSTGEQSMLTAAGLRDYARVLRSAGNSVRAQAMEDDARAIVRKVTSRQALNSFQ